MFDSLPYRNDAAIVFRRLIRSLPTRRGVIGVATCDKGLPAMMMALAASGRSAVRARAGRRHAAAGARRGRRQGQTIGARFAHGQITLEQRPTWAAAPVRSPGGGCQFLGTAATSQVVGEALGMSLPTPRSRLPGHPIWLDMARRSARALMALDATRHDDARHPDRRVGAERDGGARRVRRIDQPDPAPPGHRARRRTAAADRR